MSREVDGGVVVTTMTVPGSEDEIVLLDPESRPDGVLDWHPFRNVVRLSPQGEVRWRAEVLPQETTVKCWLGMRFDDNRLTVWTYSYLCELDLESGLVTRSTFTK
jgi:hypothetical protein